MKYLIHYRTTSGTHYSTFKSYDHDITEKDIIKFEYVTKGTVLGFYRLMGAK